MENKLKKVYRAYAKAARSFDVHYDGSHEENHALQRVIEKHGLLKRQKQVQQNTDNTNDPLSIFQSNGPGAALEIHHYSDKTLGVSAIILAKIKELIELKGTNKSMGDINRCIQMLADPAYELPVEMMGDIVFKYLIDRLNRMSPQQKKSDDAEKLKKQVEHLEFMKKEIIQTENYTKRVAAVAGYLALCEDKEALSTDTRAIVSESLRDSSVAYSTMPVTSWMWRNPDYPYSCSRGFVERLEQGIAQHILSTSTNSAQLTDNMIQMQQSIFLDNPEISAKSKATSYLNILIKNTIINLEGDNLEEIKTRYCKYSPSSTLVGLQQLQVRVQETQTIPFDNQGKSALQQLSHKLFIKAIDLEVSCTETQTRKVTDDFKKDLKEQIDYLSETQHVRYDFSELKKKLIDPIDEAIQALCMGFPAEVLLFDGDENQYRAWLVRVIDDFLSQLMFVHNWEGFFSDNDPCLKSGYQQDTVNQHEQSLKNQEESILECWMAESEVAEPESVLFFLQHPSCHTTNKIKSALESVAEYVISDPKRLLQVDVRLWDSLVDVYLRSDAIKVQIEEEGDGVTRDKLIEVLIICGSNTQNSELQDAVLKEIKNYGIAWEDKLRMAIEYDFDVLIDQSMQIDIEIDAIADKLKQLLDAVLQSNQERVMKLLHDKAISIGIEDDNCRSMLHYMAMMRSFHYIPKGQDEPYLQNLITKKDSLDKSPLDLAIEANNEHAVTWMIEKSKKTTVDYTMIVRAIKNFSAASVVFKMIANNPALVNMKNRKNRKPLTHIAISDGRMDILNYLLNQGYGWSKRDAEGKSMIDIAIKHDQHEILGYLLCLMCKQGYESPDTDKWVRNAINADKPGILDTIFTNIPDYINSILLKNTTLLIYAINVSASFAVISSMVKNGAKVNTVNNDNQTPLHLSVMSGRVDLVKLLLRNGAVTNKQDTSIAKKYQPIITDIPNGLFSKEKKKDKALVALHYAALEMSMKSADEIINYERTRYGKVDSLYKETELGLTPLHYAIMKNDKDMVSRMLDEMDINKIAQFTVSIINTAVCYRNYDILCCILRLPNASILLQEKRKVRGVIERTKRQGHETEPVVEYLNRIYYIYTEGDQNIIEKCSKSACKTSRSI